VSVYRVLYAGKWRPVTNMRRGSQVVHYPEQATAVVIEMDGAFEAIPVTLGDVMTEWTPFLPPESSWDTIS
jgi:hypothetical protein